MGPDDAAGTAAHRYAVEIDVPGLGHDRLVEELDPVIDVWERAGRLLQVRWRLTVPTGFADEEPLELLGTVTVSRVVEARDVAVPEPIVDTMGVCP